MLNLVLGEFPIGPSGIYGSVKLAFVEGQLVSSLMVSPKGCLDEAAKKLPGGAVPAEVAQFLESAIGLK